MDISIVSNAKLATSGTSEGFQSICARKAYKDALVARFLFRHTSTNNDLIPLE